MSVYWTLSYICVIGKVPLYNGKEWMLACVCGHPYVQKAFLFRRTVVCNKCYSFHICIDRNVSSFVCSRKVSVKGQRWQWCIYMCVCLRPLLITSCRRMYFIKFIQLTWCNLLRELDLVNLYHQCRIGRNGRNIGSIQVGSMIVFKQS